MTVSTATAAQPVPYTRVPVMMPRAPNNCGTAMLRMRIR